MISFRRRTNFFTTKTNYAIPLLLLGMLFSQCTPQEPMTTTSSDAIEHSVDSLLARMTLEEKVGQLVQVNFSNNLTGPAQDVSDSTLRAHMKQGKIGSLLNLVSAEQTRAAQVLVMENSRLKIPLIFGLDVIHGHQTMFPIPLALASSWDMEAVELSARVAAREASAQGIHWTFAPMMDVGHDPRWGRVMEGGGEDPYLTSRVVEANIKGFQGTNMTEPYTIAACAKHFAAYGFPIGGRDYNTVDISRNTLQNMILPPFKAAADAGIATFMNAFNEIGGVPASGSTYLQRELLKGEWGFDGFVVSDWNSIGEMVDHGFAEDKKDASRIAITAGNDMDMMTFGYLNHLEELVEEGKVDIGLVDDAVRRVLRIKFRLGLFDDPFKYCDTEREKSELGSEENLNAAREVAKKSIVLLKNEGGLLPLAKELKSVAVIGQLATDKNTPLGNWRAKAITNSAVNFLEGLTEAIGETTKVTYARGVEVFKDGGTFRDYPTVNETDTKGLAEAVALAKRSELAIVVIGEHCYQSGEGKSRSRIDLPGLQLEMLKEIYAANKNVVVVLMNGRPLALTWLDENIPAIVETWHAGSQAGHAIADVLTGNYNPSGKLTMSFPRALGQIPVYYNHKNAGRPYDPNKDDFMTEYRDESNYPLYPFGYGLSYTTFEYADFKLSKKEMPKGGSVEVSVMLKNTGEYDGEEVVQLYLRDMVASMTRPIKELKGFQKVSLKAGEEKQITFTLTEKDMEFFNAKEQWVAEPGEFKVMVGGNSVELLEGSFILK